jgi:hypothetical protein
MTQTQLIIIVLGLLGIAALSVFAYFGKRLGDVAALLDPLARALITRADVALAPYGPALAPAHELVSAVGTLIDEDTDPLVRALRHPAVIAALRSALSEIIMLTDGQLATDATGAGAPVTTIETVIGPTRVQEPLSPPQEAPPDGAAQETVK